MSPSQIRATEIVLKKSVPDLMNAELTGEGGGPVVIKIVKYDGD